LSQNKEKDQPAEGLQKIISAVQSVQFDRDNNRHAVSAGNYQEKGRERAE
jgi:hypothetical protein